MELFLFFWSMFIKGSTVGQGKKKMKHPYLFQYKLWHRSETGTNHHELLSTSS